MVDLCPETIDEPRIVHLSPVHGGVANAARNLHRGLLQLKIDSKLFLTDGSPPHLPDPGILRRPAQYLRPLDQGMRWLNRRFGLTGITHLSSLFWDFPEADVIHLHGMDSDQFNLTALKRWKQHALVWTMHDKHLGTGACGYPEMWNGCENWRNGCGQCAKAKAHGWWVDLTRRVYKRKVKIFRSISIAVVAPNSWMFDFISKSHITQNQLLRLIPYAVDTEIFTPLPKDFSRVELGLPPEGRLILMVASRLDQPRKGLQYLLPLLQTVARTSGHWPLGLVLVGSAEESCLSPIRSFFPVHLLGRIDNTRKLAQVYSACDLFLIPSLIDNSPGVILESLACGRPVAGFRVGGIPDLVIPGRTGFLAEIGDTERLGSQIRAMFESPELERTIQRRCREEAVEKHRLEIQAKRYLDLYFEQLTKRKALAA